MLPRIKAKNTFNLVEDPNHLTYIIEKGPHKFQLYFHQIQDADTKELVYCLEPGVQLSNEEYQEWSEWEYAKLNLTETEKDWITRIAYFGYGYESHDLNFYYAAQELIWHQIIPDDWQIYFTDRLGGNRIDPYQKEKQEILKLVENDQKLPSFAGQNLTWNSNHEYHIVDENKVLSKYHINLKEVEISENQLIIPANFNNQTKIIFQKQYLGEPLKFYLHENGQNVLKKGSLKSQEFSISLNPYQLTIEVLKTGEQNEVLENVTFALCTKEKCLFEKTTDEEGNLIFTNLDEGEYFLKEIKTKVGYQILTEPIPIALTKEKPTIKLHLINKLHQAKITIYKKEEQSKQLLSNVRFQIWNEQEDCIYDGKTNEKGEISLSLPIGNYKLVEIETLPDYVLKKEPYYFQVTDKDTSLDITITNPKIEKVPNTYDTWVQWQPEIMIERRKYQ